MPVNVYTRRTYHCDAPGCTVAGDTDVDPLAGDHFRSVVVDGGWYQREQRAVLCVQHVGALEAALAALGFTWWLPGLELQHVDKRRNLALERIATVLEALAKELSEFEVLPVEVHGTVTTEEERSPYSG